MRRTLMAVTAAALTAAAACRAPAVPPATPAAPAYVEYAFPGPAAQGGDERLAAQHRAAWQLLQRGDLHGATVEYSALVKRAPGYVEAEVGLAYVLLAQQRMTEAVAWFDHAMRSAPRYAPAVVGRAEAYVAAGQRDLALAGFEAALKLDPSMADVARRLEMIRFARIGELTAAARKAIDDGRYDEGRRIYLEAVQTSPDSAVLYRDLGSVELKMNATVDAVDHLRRSVSLDGSDVRALAALGDALEKLDDVDGALDAWGRADRIDSTESTKRALARLRERASTTRLPVEARAIARAAQVTRGDLAALIGLRLAAWLAAAERPTAVLATDVRGHWAEAWIFAVVRAGVMDVYNNHTFQPSAVMRRIDAAQVVTRVLAMTPAAGDRARGRMPIGDMAPDHLGYADAMAAVGSGVMDLADGAQFHPARLLTGAEAVDIVDRLERLTRKTAR